MDISIIIPSFNTAELTIACLKDLHDRPPRHTHEIIVVDNCSHDHTVATLRRDFGNITLIANQENLGFSKACNLGARKSSGRYICFLNSDTLGGGSAMDILMEWLDNHPETGIAGPELRASDNQLAQMSWQWHPVLGGEFLDKYLSPKALTHSSWKRTLVEKLQRQSRHVPIITGASLMIRRTIFEQLSGFDEDFELYFEDCDLCWRCRKSGWEVDFVKAAAVTHLLGQSSQKSWQLTALIYQQSHLRYYRRHATAAAVWLLKFYLWLKWLSLKEKSWSAKDSRTRSKAYCQAYLLIILEKKKLYLRTLSQLAE